MEACGFLLRIILAVFLGICVFSCSCDAASPCPVRAIRVFTLEGVECVCKDAFYGEKCQLRGKMRNYPLALLPWKEKFNSDFKNYFYAKKKRFENVFPVFYRRAPTEIQNSNFSTILKLRES
jgi:hypothetical protein